MKATFFTENRHNLAASLKGGLTVLSAYQRQQRSNDSAHSFVQESNFWYLTGIEEPDWMVIIDGSIDKSWLVAPDVEEVHATFDGSLSPETAKRISGVNSVITADESIVLLRKLAKTHGMVNTVGKPTHADHFNFSLNPSIAHNWQMLERHFAKVNDIQRELNALRAIKRPEEISVIRQAIDYTIEGFERIKKTLNTYKHEYEIEADFNHVSGLHVSAAHAYDPIIAAGSNACTLHYMKNSDKLISRQLVLMDVGASYGGYAADITRTYAKGEPTKRQREIHTAVETAHHRIINLIEPMKSVQEYQKDVDTIMSEALESIGLAHDEAGIRRYMPHAISHGLGIDVHDSLGAPKYFVEGMVLTVEPGIYVPEEKIGVRIEDDILVTSKGNENLSARLSTGL